MTAPAPDGMVRVRDLAVGAKLMHVQSRRVATVRQHWRRDHAFLLQWEDAAEDERYGFTQAWSAISSDWLILMEAKS